MGLMMTLVGFGVVVALGAWTISRFVPGRGRGDAEDHQGSNVIFWFVGSVTALVGVIMLVAGAKAVADVEDSFHGTGPQDTADAASLFTWGAVILVNGVYVWRGARRRGLPDRLGRVLIVVGYVLLAVAMDRSIHISVDLWATATQEESNDVLNRTMLAFLGWGIPAAAMVWLGTRLAREKILMTAEGHTHSG